MSNPPAQTWSPQCKTFWRRFCPGPQTRGTFGGSYPQILYVLRKFVSNIW